MTQRSRTLVRVALAMTAALLAGQATATASTTDTPTFGEGSSGVGDAYFPLAGNGGIDITHYHLSLHYTPPDPGSGASGGDAPGQDQD